MADLFSHYEQQFGNISAEITARICKIPNLHGTSKKAAISDVERCFDEARELIEQMELEVREVSGEEKAKLGHRLKAYRNEMQRFQQDLKKARIAFSDQEGRNELLGGEDSQSSEDQRTRLLDNTERLERTGKHLEEGYKMCVETDVISGITVVSELKVVSKWLDVELGKLGVTIRAGMLQKTTVLGTARILSKVEGERWAAMARSFRAMAV